MGRNELRLLGAWFSPIAVRVRIALNIKGLEYENIEENLNSKSDLLLESNPVYKKIPVLLHEDKIICESAIIIEYIDEVWKNNGHSIVPSNAYDRAIARFWVAYIDDKLYHSLRNAPLAQDDEARKSSFEQMVEVVVKLEDVFNKYSEGKEYFGGDKIGVIDIAFGCYLSWLGVIEKMTGNKILDEAKAPGLVKWAQAFSAHPAVKGVLPDTDRLMEFAKVFVQNLVAAAASTATPK